MGFELHVVRDASCAADDQTMPLEMTLNGRGKSLADILQSIVQSSFLQFSSTHTTLTACSGNRKLASISAGKVEDYYVAPHTAVEDCIVCNELELRFAHGLRSFG